MTIRDINDLKALVAALTLAERSVMNLSDHPAAASIREKVRQALVEAGLALGDLREGQHNRSDRRLQR